MSLLRGMDRIPGRQVLILPLRCTVYSFQRKKRKRRRMQATENGDWRSHLFTAFCFDFEQVDLEALLHLAGLLLGCGYLGAQTGDLLGTHSTGSPARWAPGPLHHALTIAHRRARVPLWWVPGGFHSPPPTLFSFTRTGTEPKNSCIFTCVNTCIFMLSTSRPESDCPRPGHKDYSLIAQEEGQIAK